MSIIPIRKAADASPAKVKEVEANQKSVDALPLNSGMWKVQCEAGLYIRCRAASKSFMLQRRIDRDLVKMTLKSRTLKAAKEEANRQWGALKCANSTIGNSKRVEGLAGQCVDGVSSAVLNARTPSRMR